MAEVSLVRMNKDIPVIKVKTTLYGREVETISAAKVLLDRLAEAVKTRNDTIAKKQAEIDTAKSEIDELNSAIDQAQAIPEVSALLTIGG